MYFSYHAYCSLLVFVLGERGTLALQMFWILEPVRF